MVILIAVFVSLLCGPFAHATTYYVSTSGSDSNNGTSETTPFLTPAKASATMVAGDTTYVRGGTYVSGTIRFSRSGTQAAPIKMLNYPGERPVVDCVDGHTTYKTFHLENSGGASRGIGWITIEGFEIKRCWFGIRGYNLHDSVLRRNYIHDSKNNGMLMNGSLRLVIDRNIIEHNGFPDDTPPGGHGLYINGSSHVITNNVLINNRGLGIQQNGNMSFSSTQYPSTEFAYTQNWIVANNTFAYSGFSAGMTVWGANCDGTRIENNVFYENGVEGNPSSGVASGVEFLGAGSSTGVSVRNNHVYASGSGLTVGIDSGGPVDAVITGNVVNVSAPAFVNGGTNSLPASPDFRLTASAPVNIARANEFLNNTTSVVGAFKTVPTPTAVITGRTITLTYAGMNTATPIRNISATGVTIGCTGANCPGSPTVSSATRKSGTDTQVEIVVSGIAGNACVSANQNWTVSYSSSSGAWTGNDDIGPYPGLHQKAFSFTNLAVTNNCDGSAPPAPTTSHILYAMEDGTGTTVSDTSGNDVHATLVGATWGDGKTGFGVVVEGGTTQQWTIPYGLGIDPTTTSMTWVVPVFISAGQTSATNFVFGTESGADQRGYIVARDGTWRVGRQTITSVTAGASSLSVSEGWNHLCVRWDAGTDTATLYKDGVAGTGGATGTYTTYTLATNFEAPILGSAFPGTVTQTTYDDVQIFTSLQDCAALYSDWNAAPPPVITGELVQAAVQAQAVYLSEIDGSPTNLVSLNTAKNVVTGGALAWVFQLHCADVADCDETSFRLAYRKNGTGAWQQIPNDESADGVWLWGISADPFLNKNVRTTRLTGTCAVTDGVTLLTAAQVPSINLPQDGCVMLAWIIRYRGTDGDYIEHRVETEGGVTLTTYSNLARANIIATQAGGF